MKSYEYEINSRLQVVKQDLKCEYDKINMQKYKLEMEKNALCSSKFEEVGHPTEESHYIQFKQPFATQLKRM